LRERFEAQFVKDGFVMDGGDTWMKKEDARNFIETELAQERERLLGELTVKRNLGGDIPCSDCGTEDNIRWFTDNVFWNAVMDDNLVHNQRNDKKETGILCPQCFVARTLNRFKPTGWRLVPEFEWQEAKIYPQGE
jgi:hypothetical protein